MGQRQAVQLEQEQIRRRIDPAQRAVELERCRRGRTLRPLRRDALEDVAQDDVLLHLAHHREIPLPVGEAAYGAGGAACLALPRDACIQPAGHLLVVAHHHLCGAGAMVEADERLGHDQAALREPVPLVRQRHRRLESSDVVVREVADDGHA